MAKKKRKASPKKKAVGKSSKLGKHAQPSQHKTLHKPSRRESFLSGFIAPEGERLGKNWTPHKPMVIADDFRGSVVEHIAALATAQEAKKLAGEGKKPTL